MGFVVAGLEGWKTKVVGVAELARRWRRGVAPEELVATDDVVDDPVGVFERGGIVDDACIEPSDGGSRPGPRGSVSYEAELANELLDGKLCMPVDEELDAFRSRPAAGEDEPLESSPV